MVLRLLGSSFVALAVAASAQWPNSNTGALVVADRSNEQVQPKIATRRDGGCYISWFDNAAGGYDVYLQRLDRYGNEMWPHNGILIADRGLSSTTDYDLDVDSNGNAILTFNDDRSGSDQITAQRVDPSGNLLWGALGVSVTSGTGFKASPKIVELTDGSFVVGWTASGLASVRKLDVNGLPLGPAIDIVESGHAILMDDLTASTSGGWIAMFWRCWTTNSVTSSKHLYSRRFHSDGAVDWTTIVYGPLGAPYGSQGGSIQNGTFPPIHSDGAGGFVTAWYETGGPRHAYIQHVFVDGSVRFPTSTPNGLSVTGDTPGRIQVSCSVAYNRDEDAYYVASWDTDSGTQSQNRTFVQKIDGAGNRLWGSSGLTVIPTNGNQPSFVQALSTCDGLAIFGFDSRSINTGVVFGAAIDTNGLPLWGVTSPSLPCADVSGKARLALARSSATAGDGAGSTIGFTILAWTNGASGSGDVWSQRVNDGGGIGNAVEGRLYVLDSVTNRPKNGEVELRQGGSHIETIPLFVCPDGTFAFSTDRRGTYDMRFRSLHTLVTQISSVTITNDGADVGFVILVNGDVDGDNEVAIGDYAILSSAFGSMPGDPNWVEAADIDDDGEVTIGDFAVLSNNFGLEGD